VHVAVPTAGRDYAGRDYADEPGVHQLSCWGGATSVDPDQNIFVTVSIFVDGNLVGFAQAWGYMPSAHATGTVPWAEYPRTIECYLEAPFVYARARGTILPTYLVPTGETTIENAWSELIPTAYK
jgi:hypothetical protein